MYALSGSRAEEWENDAGFGMKRQSPDEINGRRKNDPLIEDFLHFPLAFDASPVTELVELSIRVRSSRARGFRKTLPPLRVLDWLQRSFTSMFGRVFLSHACVRHSCVCEISRSRIRRETETRSRQVISSQESTPRWLPLSSAAYATCAERHGKSWIPDSRIFARGKHENFIYQIILNYKGSLKIGGVMCNKSFDADLVRDFPFGITLNFAEIWQQAYPFEILSKYL